MPIFPLANIIGFIILLVIVVGREIGERSEKKGGNDGV